MYPRALCSYATILAAIGWLVLANGAIAAPPSNSIAVKDFGKLPLAFEVNQGQAPSAVKYLSRGQGYSLYLTNSSAILSLSGAGKLSPRTTHGQGSEETYEAIRMSLSGANSNAPADGVSELPGRINYFIGDDPAKWHSNLPTYSQVRYTNVYPGIDLVYYGSQRQLEYDFIVAPGASPAPIRLSFSGQKHLSLAPNGDLILDGRSGQATLHKPVIYQEQDGLRHPVPGAFRLMAHNVVTFQLGSYDHSRALVIDPILAYSTYLGGKLIDWGNDITIDADKNVYVVGYTASTDFPVTAGAYQLRDHEPSYGPTCGFISKIDPTGSSLVFSTYLCGTGGSDSVNSVALDSDRNVYVVGVTSSHRFPVTKGAFQTANPIPSGGDTPTISPFVTKLSADGSKLIYSTYLDGTNGSFGGPDMGQAIAVNANGNAYVGGATYATDFPVTPGAFQTAKLNPLAQSPTSFVVELNTAGTGLVYGTYLGGTGNQFCNCPDAVGGIALDSDGNLYVAGGTYNQDFPVTPGAFQTVNHSQSQLKESAYVAKLNAMGTGLIYATYLGGSNDSQAYRIVIDSAGFAYVAGAAYAGEFPVAGPIQTSVTVGRGAFIAKLNPSGSALVYSTVLGGSVYQGAYTDARALAVDKDGNAYIAGPGSFSYAPRTANAFPATKDSLLIAKINAQGNALKFSTLFGGGFGYANGMAIDDAANIYVTGWATSSSFPTTSGAFQAANPDFRSDGNAFISKFDLSGETTDYFPVNLSIEASAAAFNFGHPVTITVNATSPSGEPIPSGKVIVTGLAPNTTELTLDGTGTAAWTSSSLSPGDYTAAVTYGGDAHHFAPAPLPAFSTQFTVYGGPAVLINESTLDNFPYGYPGTYLIGVKVTDTAGHPVEGVTVNFSGAFLKFRSLTEVTDATGIAYGHYSGLKAGLLTAYASVSGIPQPIAIPLHIQKAPLTVILRGQTRAYGAPNPTFASIVTGLIGSDMVTILPQTPATPTSPLGDYPVTATLGGPDASNYGLALTPAILRVVKAVVSVVADSQTVVYGQSPATPTDYSFRGFVNGDTAAVVSGAPTLTTNATSASPAGYYPISVGVGGLSATNYSFAPFAQRGVVHIVKAPLTLAASNLTIHRGDPIPVFAYNLTGFVNGDSQASSVTGAPLLKTEAGPQTRPGAYPIYIGKGTLISPNYFFTPVNGVLTILP